MLIGYVCVPTNSQDLTTQRNALAAAGVDPDVIYVDHGFTGTNVTSLACVRPWLPAVTATP